MSLAFEDDRGRIAVLRLLADPPTGYGVSARGQREALLNLLAEADRDEVAAAGSLRRYGEHGRFLLTEAVGDRTYVRRLGIGRDERQLARRSRGGVAQAVLFSTHEVAQRAVRWPKTYQQLVDRAREAISEQEPLASVSGHFGLPRCVVRVSLTQRDRTCHIDLVRVCGGAMIVGAGPDSEPAAAIGELGWLARTTRLVAGPVIPLPPAEELLDRALSLIEVAFPDAVLPLGGTTTLTGAQAAALLLARHCAGLPADLIAQRFGVTERRAQVLLARASERVSIDPGWSDRVRALQHALCALYESPPAPFTHDLLVRAQPA